jgi:predicted small metal-binding protein
VDKTLSCDCGFIAQGPDDVGLATVVRRHAWEAHGMPLSQDDVLLLLFHVELAGATTIPATTKEGRSCGGSFYRWQS